MCTLVSNTCLLPIADSVLPVIRTRAEQWLSAVQERAEDTLHVSNPPPSPVTDGRDCSSDADTNHFSVRDTTDPVENVAENLGNLLNSQLPPTSSSNISISCDPRAVNSTSYDEDYLDIMCNDDMDLFWELFIVVLSIINWFSGRLYTKVVNYFFTMTGLLCTIKIKQNIVLGFKLSFIQCYV